MGVIRGSLLIVVSVILFIVVLLGSIFSVLSLSLEYENVQSEFGGVVKNLTENKLLVEGDFNLTIEMERARDFMIEHCQNEKSYVFESGGYTFDLPCSLLITGTQSTEEFIDAGIDNIIYDIYYDDYNCNFWNCFTKTKLPLFLISEKAKNYWQEKFYFSLIIFAILAVLVFLLVEQKQNTFIIIGGIFVVSSLILLRLEKLPAFLIGESYSQFVEVFFSKIPTVFLILLILGIVLVIIGISLRLLLGDFLKKKFSKKDVKEIVKEEVNKEKSQSKKTEEKKKVKKKK
ncbi:MAG: hypothetical protein ABIH65_03310 [Nanoarchaeota archaeon]